LTYNTYHAIEEWLPGFVFKDCSSLFENLRMIKSAEELTFLKVAHKLASLGVKTAMDSIGVGVDEIELNRLGDEAIRDESSSQYPDFQIRNVKSWTVSGPVRSASPHASTSSEKLRVGDSVTHVRVVTCNSYWAESERTFLIEPNEELKRIFDVAMEAQQEAIRAVRPGIKASEIDKITRGIIRDSGYGDYIYHRTGHGIGLEPQEPPFLEEGNETLLEPGMVFSVEPGIYVRGIGGVRQADMVLVTDSGSAIFD